MKRYACILLALLFAGCAASRRSAVATAPQEKQYAVILSMDAFRWDLAGRSHTPTLDSLARVGTYAEIYPVYPSNTFPSHYAMATGLHPDHHGVVNNGFYDRTQGRRLSVFDSLDVRTPGFWAESRSGIRRNGRGLRPTSSCGRAAKSRSTGIRRPSGLPTRRNRPTTNAPIG